ncbi:hypothetical protein ABMA27_004925 [Loxostege sticticalis]|uniref:Uncharacterized protein n=1 Tax=Loxostege sticticalis TaxID=481309 RepID=A0ABR3HL59_LOXSC
MKTVLVLAALVALAVATVPKKFVKTKPVDEVTVERQYKILELFEAIKQVNPHSEYYKIGQKYDIKANIENYTNKQAVEEFFHYYDNGYYKHQHTFTIFNEEMRTEAKYLYELFYTAKDFDTFYKTAAWARYYLNKNLFAYTFYIAALQRPDTAGLVLPAFFEIWPQFFANMNVFKKMYAIKSKGLPYEQFPEYGVVEDGNQFVFYSNYSDYHSFGYGKDEYKISYFTEDIGWNTYYNFFHSVFPFWQKGDNIAFGLFKERRGEIYYYFYQQLLARYYLERLTNGLGQIPTFSWYQTFKSGYYPFMNYVNYPFVQRSDEYFMQTKKNLDDLRFVRNYEDTFLTWLEQGKNKKYTNFCQKYIRGKRSGHYASTGCLFSMDTYRGFFIFIFHFR